MIQTKASKGNRIPRSERQADAPQERSQAAPRETAEKGGSQPTFKTKSCRKSKHS